MNIEKCRRLHVWTDPLLGRPATPRDNRRSQKRLDPPLIAVCTAAELQAIGPTHDDSSPSNGRTSKPKRARPTPVGRWIRLDVGPPTRDNRAILRCLSASCSCSATQLTHRWAGRFGGGLRLLGCQLRGSFQEK